MASDWTHFTNALARKLIKTVWLRVGTTASMRTEGPSEDHIEEALSLLSDQYPSTEVVFRCDPSSRWNGFARVVVSESDLSNDDKCIVTLSCFDDMRAAFGEATREFD
jgi:hypothetical protein